MTPILVDGIEKKMVIDKNGTFWDLHGKMVGMANAGVFRRWREGLGVYSEV